MDDYIPYDLPPDDDTEEMEPREYRPLPPVSSIEFPDFELWPDVPLDISDLSRADLGSLPIDDGRLNRLRQFRYCDE